MVIDIQALVDYAQELETASVGTGLAWLQARRGEALAKLNGGGGAGAIISTTVDGQTFTRSQSGAASANEWFSALQMAIQRLNDGAAKIVYPRFGSIPL